jgi:HAD superfamily hydrolase (TIGR01509 family)
MTPIRGVLFDLDGTLIHQELDFPAIRREIGLPPGAPLLEALAAMSPAERSRADEIIHRHESAAAGNAAVLPGVAALLAEIDRHGLRRGILTRNSRPSTEVALAAAGLTGFDPVLTRDDDIPPKPDPGGVLRAAAAWRLPSPQVLMVGDFLFDIRAGRAAGARTLLITHGEPCPYAHEADWVIGSYADWPVGVVSGGRFVL